MTTSESTPNTAAKSALHVVAAVISHGEDILVAKRSRASHQGGKWEFPGGKVRATESARDALARELYEELGITVEAAYPLIQVRHTYPDKTVFLDVWCVTDFQGKPHGREGQHVSWVKAEQLNALDFPNANHPIVQAARLPALYAISDCSRIGEHRFLEKLERGLAAGIRLLQLREPHLGTEAYQTLARRVVQLCHRWGAKVLLNCEPEWVQACKADGVHLNSQRLRALHTRPLSRDYWVAASTHNAEELAQAACIEADFVVLAPVLPTRNHPHATPMGWQRFEELCAGTNVPVYALGGMQPQHLDRARQAGAQGLAMISGVWDAPDMEKAIAAMRDA